MRIRMLLCLCVAAITVGCAGAKVVQARVDLPKNQITKTDPIYVKDFDASKTVFKGDYSNVQGKVEAQRTRIPSVITSELVNHLNNKGYRADKYSGDVQGNAVVVEGEVTMVDSGSGAARFWVGMGAGASTVKANVKIWRGSDPKTPLADLEMAGTSAGAGGFAGYQDWVAANSKDLAIKLGNYIMGKK